MINGGIRIVAVWTSHPGLEELLSDVVELQRFHKTSRTWKIKELAAVLFGSSAPFPAFLSHAHRGAVAQNSLAARSGMDHYKTFGHRVVFVPFFFSLTITEEHLPHISSLSALQTRPNSFLLFCVKGSSSSWKSCVFSGICMMEHSSVQMAVCICINKYLWSQLQRCDAKIILFLGTRENFKI